MKFFREDQSFDARALQLGRQRLHFSARVREVRVADSWSYHAAALDSNLEPAQHLGRVSHGIVRAVQAVQPARMILVIESLCTEQQMQASKGATNFVGLLVSRHRLNSRCWSCQQTRRCIRARSRV